MSGEPWTWKWYGPPMGIGLSVTFTRHIAQWFYAGPPPHMFKGAPDGG